jgi:hypothetical protein
MKFAGHGHGLHEKTKPHRAVMGDLVGGIGVMLMIGAIAPGIHRFLWAPWGYSEESRVLWGLIGIGLIAAALLITRVAASLGAWHRD